MLRYTDHTEVEDELGCLSALADAWTAALALPADPWHAQVVAALLDPIIREAFLGVTVH